jgi:hypothetical protein
MIILQVNFKENTPIGEFQKFIKYAENKEIFLRSGDFNKGEKYVMLQFKNIIDELAWMVSQGFAEIKKGPE